MKAVYINLDRATERRAQIEASFAAAPHQGWELVRFAAVPAEAAAALPGRLPAPHKGCFESHRQVLAASLDDEEALFVLEDDTLFSPQAFAVVDEMLARNHDWDLLFTDAGVWDRPFMEHLAHNRAALLAERRFVATNLRGRGFCGSSAYVVRGASKRRFSALMATAASLDLEYDLSLRNACDAGALKVAACFPFVTTISGAASQISGGDCDPRLAAMADFRRMMFVDRAEPPQLKPIFERMAEV